MDTLSTICSTFRRLWLRHARDGEALFQLVKVAGSGEYGVRQFRLISIWPELLMDGLAKPGRQSLAAVCGTHSHTSICSPYVQCASFIQHPQSRRSVASDETAKFMVYMKSSCWWLQESDALSASLLLSSQASRLCGRSPLPTHGAATHDGADQCFDFRCA
jgi:hypothetical protein